VRSKEVPRAFESRELFDLVMGLAQVPLERTEMYYAIAEWDQSIADLSGRIDATDDIRRRHHLTYLRKLLCLRKYERLFKSTRQDRKRLTDRIWKRCPEAFELLRLVDATIEWRIKEKMELRAKHKYLAAVRNKSKKQIEDIHRRRGLLDVRKYA